MSKKAKGFVEPMISLYAIHNNVHYVCEPDGCGWKCGKCGRGRLFHKTKKCAVCLADIANTIVEAKELRRSAKRKK